MRFTERTTARRILVVIALIGAPAMGTGLAPSVAQAQEPAVQPVFADLLIELLPSGEVVGDGLTAVSWKLLAYDRNGAPMTGLNAKLAATDGSAGKLTEVQPGLYSVDWTPPSVQATRSVEITVKGKTPDKETFSRTWSVPVTPPLAQMLTATSNPPQIVLGQDTSATVTLTLSGGAAQAAAESELVVSCSSGTVANLTPLGDGRYTALFTPPAKQFPHLALITMADRRDPTRTYGTLTIPLVGKANFPVTGMPGSRVILKLGDREFGPIQADASGRAQVPIVVPPGESMATVISVLADKKTEEPLDLQIPPAPRVRLFPLHSSLAADSSISVPVRAYVATATGGVDAAAQVAFTATAGTMSEPRHEGNGVYLANYTPPFGNTATKVTIQVSVTDAKGPQTDILALDLIPARPSQVGLTPEPARLTPDAGGFKVFAKVTGGDGVGMSGRELAFVANGAKLNGKVSDLGNGDYQAQFATTGTGPVELLATARSAASSNPLRRIVVLPTRDHLPNDGLSSSMLTVLTLDEFGYPVTGVPVELKVVQGEATVPATATTDEAGLAQVHLTAGRKAGLINVQVTGRGHTGGVAILQVPPNVAAGMMIPLSGSATKVAQENAWRSIVTNARIERDGMTGAVMPTPTKATAGPVTRVAVASEPASVAPGGTVTLRVQAQDAEGRGAGGQAIEFVVSAGTVGAVQDLGGGSYQTTLSVPMGIAGEVKISAAIPDVGVAGFLKLPISGASTWQAVAATPATPPVTPAPVAPSTIGTTPAPIAEVKQPKPPREPGKWPWLRVQGGYLGGLYSYEQTPLTSNGPLYSRSISVGGDAGSPGGAAGIALRGRVWVPGLEFLGADVGLRSSHWAMELAEYFDEPVSDWITNLHVNALARYPFDAGANHLHVGARVGLLTNDFIVYKQETDNQLPVMVYEQLVISGFNGGVEVGGEFGPKVFGLAGFDLGFADLSELYSTAFDVTVGYVVMDNLFVEANGGYSARDTAVYSVPANGSEKNKVGELKDSFTMFGVGVGFQM